MRLSWLSRFQQLRLPLARRLLPSPQHPYGSIAIAVLTLTAVIAGTVLVASVNERQAVLDDGSVWVTSAAHGRAARFLTDAMQADTAVDLADPYAAVAQHDDVVALVEETHVRLIDARTATPGSPMAAQGPVVAAANGGVLAVMEVKTGMVWAAPDAQRMTPTADEPCLRLGSGGRIAVDHTGMVWGYRPSDGMVLQADPVAGGAARQVGSLTDQEPLAVDAFTVVHGVPAVAAGSLIITPAGQVTVDLQGPLTLQTPPVDNRQSGWLLAAGAGGAAAVRLPEQGRKPVLLHLHESGGTGEPAVPAAVQGCVHMAWNQRAHNYLRLCEPDGAGRFRSLTAVPETAVLEVRTSHREVVVNDAHGGQVWVPDASDEPVSVDWSLGDQPRETAERTTVRHVSGVQPMAATCSDDSGTPAAVDDVAAVRAGGRALIDVLRNDRGTDCSVLHITGVSRPDNRLGILIVAHGRLLQLDAGKAPPAAVVCSYTVSDGRGSVSSAQLTIQIVDAGNRPPQQVVPPATVAVEQGATVTVHALAGFADPDGDAMALVAAQPAPADGGSVMVRADGALTFAADADAPGRVTVTLTVSDGRSTGNGTITFRCADRGSLPPLVEPASAAAAPDRPVTVDLAPYVHATGLQPVRLTSVTGPDGAEVQPVEGSPLMLRFRSPVPGTQYVPYRVAQGSVETTGLLRVDVREQEQHSVRETPRVADDVVVLNTHGVAVVEPLANDVDSAGGVLSLVSATVPQGSGLTVAVVAHERLLIRAQRMPETPVPVSVTIAGTGGEARGVVTVLPASAQTAALPLRAQPVTARVRTGGVITVPVTQQLTAMGAVDLTVNHRLEREEGFQGLAFVSNTTVRYQAPHAPGTYQLTVTVHDAQGNTGTVPVTFAVHTGDAANKAAPRPRDCQAHAAAGTTVRIPIDLTGIDQDGDDVQLLGLGDQAPRLGRIIEVDATGFRYEAYAQSHGTDVFTYAVEDWTGRRAQGTIRVGVFPSAQLLPPIARDDAVTLRPGAHATVPVLLNDESCDGSALTLNSTVTAQGLTRATVEDGRIRLTAPQQDSATGYVAYTVQDGHGLTAQAMLTVHVDAGAPPEPPQAADIRVSAEDTVNRKAVEVDTAPWVSLPSGSTPQVRIHAAAAAHARTATAASTVLTIELTEHPRAVPYVVTDPATGLQAFAFVHVPAYGVFPPVLRPNAPPLTVRARQTLTIPLADHVRVGPGKEPLIADRAAVSATRSDGSALVVDDRTLRFTPAEGYEGPASITVPVTDGRPSAAQSARTLVHTATLTLPITVTGSGNTPPSLMTPLMDVPAGGEITLDLTRCTRTVNGTAGNSRLTYRGGVTQAGVQVTISSGGMLHARANTSAQPGTLISAPVTVNYGAGTVRATVGLRVTASTRPLARVPDITVRIVRGQSVSRQMLADAYNPFAPQPLKLQPCAVPRQASGGSSALTVLCRSDGTITITAGQQAGHATHLITVTVADATEQAERYSTVTITVVVLAPPGAPLPDTRVQRPRRDAVYLTWSPGASGGSPVIAHEVRAAGHGTVVTQPCGTAASCTVTKLRQGSRYRFAVRARNEAGWSPWSQEVEALIDQPPPAPASVTVTGGYRMVQVSWSMPPFEGSQPDRYAVTLHGVSGTAMVTGGTSHVFHLDEKELHDSTQVSATVAAGNLAGMGEAASSSAPARPYGMPQQPQVEAEVEITAGSAHTRVTVSGTLGDMRNTTCSNVEVALGGDDAVPVPCHAIRAIFPLSATELDGTVTPQITVHTTQGLTVTAAGPPLTVNDIRQDPRDGSRVQPSHQSAGVSP